MTLSNFIQIVSANQLTHVAAIRTSMSLLGFAIAIATLARYLYKKDKYQKYALDIIAVSFVIISLMQLYISEQFYKHEINAWLTTLEEEERDHKIVNETQTYINNQLILTYILYALIIFIIFVLIWL